MKKFWELYLASHEEGIANTQRVGQQSICFIAFVKYVQNMSDK
jgi:hypothetical protein